VKDKCKVTVVQDFPEEIVKVRQVFEPIVRTAKSLDSVNTPLKATLSIDRLILNKKAYSIDDIDKLPPPLQPKNVFTPRKGNLTAFYSRNSPLSNHYPCNLLIDGKSYVSNEQYYCERKASKFGDIIKAQQIMSEKDPGKIKNMSKSINNYDHSIWVNCRDDIMKKGLLCKFSQNHDLKDFLLATGETTLVEASPYDNYWGTGCSLWNNNLWKPATWVGKGKNMMGKLLEDIRREIKNS
jgi:ribA/ribD-fused uncharacterized protein